ncbi:uncharacterized protein LOC142978431 isoform X1 [Anticarsia gemmatalis]|uniref:uncharacterized protein LOC142978431 isoform X1 n=1 Tax=Anticarsia gemmatalis TaxID=129554 RepID=UPI003F766A45
MKSVLYIILVSFAFNHAEFIDDTVNVNLLPLLEEDEGSSVTGMDGFTAYALNTKNEIEKDLTLDEETILSSQYLVTGAFKTTDQKKRWCLFSLTSYDDELDDDITILSLCFQVIAINTTRIIWKINEAEVQFELSEYYENKWVKIAVDVKDNAAFLRINCSQIGRPQKFITTPPKSVELKQDMKINLARADAKFDVVVQDLRLYYKSDDGTLKRLCEDIFGSDDDDFFGVFNRSSDGLNEDECHCKEETFAALLKRPEFRGAQGEIGPPGKDGKDGQKGEPGPIGERGALGPKGEPGKKGEIGPLGPIGQKGEKGEEGKEGKQGKQGPVGPIGPTGPEGPRGPRYVETKEEIEAMILGIDGLKGEKGERGLRGDVGPRGEPGVNGKDGPRGERGERGDDGLPGEYGDPGEDGMPGERGEKGDKGAPGEAGLPASLTSLLYEDIPPKERKQIIEKLRGLKGDQGVPGKQGERGEIGPEGVKGEPGLDGEDGLDGLKGDKGDKGDIGPQGPQGERGLRGEPGPAGTVPAHEIARLKGDRGEKGDQGLEGPQGITGKKGEKGDLGPKGHRGHHGDRGLPGIEGPMGPPGLNGTDGMKGEKGDTAPVILVKGVKGDMGNPGPEGKPGEKGSKGERGFTGPQGPHGVRGPRGLEGLRGEKGDMGPPGIAELGPKGEKGDSYFRDFHEIPEESDDEDFFYPVNTFVYRTVKALMRATQRMAVGTLVYVVQEQILLIKVNRTEWSNVMLSSWPPSQAIRASTDPVKPPTWSNQHNIETIPPATKTTSTTTTPKPTTTSTTTTTTTTPKPTTTTTTTTTTTPKPTTTSTTTTTTTTPKPTTTSTTTTTTTTLKPTTTSTTTTTTTTPRPRPTTTSTTTTMISPRPRRRSIRLVALNDRYPGKIKNKKEDADQMCRDQSIRFGKQYRKYFKAFRAHRAEDLKHLITRPNWDLPVVNALGDQLFDSWESMFNGSGAVFKSNIYTFSNINVLRDTTPHKRKLWHGGTMTGQFDGRNCHDWLSASPNDTGTGSSLRNNMLLSAETFTCDQELIVLCVGILPHYPRQINTQRYYNNNYIRRRRRTRHHHNRTLHYIY